MTAFTSYIYIVSERFVMKELQNLTTCLPVGTTYSEWGVDALLPRVSNQVVSTRAVI